MPNIKPLVRAFIVSEFVPDTAPAELADDYDLHEGGVIDSLSLLSVVTWIGRHFGVDMDSVELKPEHFRSIDSIAAFIGRHAPVAAQLES